MRLRIVNESGLEMELAADQVITVDKNNPLFNDPDSFFQDIGYPGTAPFTQQNKLFFGMAHLVETSNTGYTIQVRCYADEVPLSAGNIRFRISPDGFEFNLEPNYAAINALITNIRLPEIHTDDADRSITNYTDFAAMMLDNVQNPDKYPYIFFPVQNPGMSPNDPGNRYEFVNYFDVDAQVFKTMGPGNSYSEGWAWGQTPFFKVSYILKQVFKYLGFTASGNFFTDPATKNICIYTRISSIHQVIYPSTRYMPNMLLSDFFKQLRERLHLSIDFDLYTGTATVETFETILNDPEIIDLSPYVTNVVEQEVPDGNGFSVTLKSDEQDAKFKVTDGDDETYPPLFRLTAGDGASVVELDCSTTVGVDEGATTGLNSPKYCSVDQSVINGHNWPVRVYGGIGLNGLPPDLSPNDPDDPTTVNNWPLRLVQYTGWQALNGGGYFPCSAPLDLDTADKNWFRFQNDSKRLIVSALLPPAVLASLKVTKKCGYKTAGLNFTRFVIEKHSADLPNDAQLIPVKFYVRTLDYDINTKVNVLPIGQANPISQYTFGRIKAYFDNSVKGFDQIDITVIGTGSGSSNTWVVEPIVNPTNAGGTGGVASHIVLTDPFIGDIHHQTAEIRISRGNPKYMVFLGQRTYFINAGSYWYVPIDMKADNANEFLDFYWIVF